MHYLCFLKKNFNGEHVIWIPARLYIYIVTSSRITVPAIVFVFQTEKLQLFHLSLIVLITLQFPIFIVEKIEVKNRY